MKIRPPAELTAGQRFLVTLIIALAILFALAAFGYFTGRWQEDETHGNVAARQVT